MKVPTRQEVIERSESCPLLCEVLRRWGKGKLTWNQAMMVTVVELDEQRKDLLSAIYVQKRDANLSRRSQIQSVGTPPPKTWDDYRKGCLSTFGGGYRTKEELEVFQHGMNTVFNLLQAELPDLVELRRKHENSVHEK